MNIDIIIKNEIPKKRNNVLVVKGEIRIKDFKENLFIPLDWWTLNNYKTQWKEAMDHLKNHDSSCLIVAINNPHYRRFIEWWPIYKKDNKLHIQNHMIFGDIYKDQIGNKIFTRETCYNFVPEYEDYDEDGNKISEWVLDFE